MKHNEAMLDILRKAITGNDFPSEIMERLAESACGFCKTYAEVMNFDLAHQIEDMRWRSMDEKPEDGQTIECLVYDNHAIELWEYVEHVNTERIRAMNFQGWRPFRGMSEVQEVVE